MRCMWTCLQQADLVEPSHAVAKGPHLQCVSNENCLLLCCLVQAGWYSSYLLGVLQLKILSSGSLLLKLGQSNGNKLSRGATRR